mgnify:CR=1 FL=1
MPNEPPLADETRTQSRTIDRFLGGLTVAPVRNSRLVDVKFDSPDPAFSANVANALAKAEINVLGLDQALRQVNMQFIVSREDFAGAIRHLHREFVES